MPRLITLLAAAVFAANLPARAQHVNGNDSPCAAAVTTIELGSCFTKARDADETQLNAVYERIRGQLETADEQRLGTAQRLWMQYWEANCIAERELYAGGTAAPTMYLACMEANDADPDERTHADVRVPVE